MAGVADQQVATGYGASATKQSRVLFSIRTMGFRGSGHGRAPAPGSDPTARERGDLSSLQ